MKHDQINAVVMKALSDVGEVVDSVQILATFNEEGGTFIISKGAGNWYARQGMAHAFINSDQARENAIQLSEVIKEDKD